jgi:hypothetical protein
MSCPDYQPHPLLPEPLSTELATAIHKAYNDIAGWFNYSRDEVHRRGICHEAAASILRSLSAKDHNVSRDRRECPGVLTGHSYVVLTAEAGTELVIDPAWQQFLGADKAQGQPPVLIGTREEVITRVEELGVPKSIATLWAAA